MRASRGLKWENKMYKVKRSITELSVRSLSENKIILYTNPYGDNLRKMVALLHIFWIELTYQVNPLTAE